MSLSADPVDYIHFRECFPEKAYGSNCRSCEVKKASLQKAAIILNKRALNPVFPYLGKKKIPASDWSENKPQHGSEHIKRISTLLGDMLLIKFNGDLKERKPQQQQQHLLFRLGGF